MIKRRGFVAGLGALVSACGRMVTVDPTPPSSPIPHLGVNVGIYDRPVPPWVSVMLQAHGRRLVCRSPVRTVAEARGMLDAMLPYPTLSTVLLIEAPDVTLAENLAVLSAHPKCQAIELGNELDLRPYDLTPQQFATWVMRVVDALRRDGFTKDIISGGIYSVDADDGRTWHARRYLAPLLAVAPADLVIGLHWYGDTSEPWQRRVRTLLNGRRCAITEFGKPSRTPSEDAQQRAYLWEKRRAFERIGASYACVYSWPCGPTTADIDNFGLQRTDGTLKPGVDVLS